MTPGQLAGGIVYIRDLRNFTTYKRISKASNDGGE